MFVEAQRLNLSTHSGRFAFGIYNFCYKTGDGIVIMSRNHCADGNDLQAEYIHSFHRSFVPQCLENMGFAKSRSPVEYVI